MLKVEKVEVGFLKENCYILKIGNKALVIDPGDDYDKIKDRLGDSSVIGILITHNHFDHIGAVNPIIKDYNTKVYDYKNLEEKEYTFDPFKFTVIKTPGHSMDSVCYYFKDEKIMFVGDFIFKNNIGRCDLQDGDIDLMYKSINKIKGYPDCIVYPGHGSETSLNIEKENNPYFKIEQV